MDLEVIFEEKGGVRKVTLNRPKKLNVLSYEMISAMLHKLELYDNDSRVKLVILKGKGKAFCVGGDVTSVNTVVFTTGNWSYGANYYRKELMLDYLLATCRKPVVALIDGVVMGGGAGLSMHSKFKIVTERTKFAMPEVAIGHFADVGASHFLSRLPGFFGEYLGLTGARLNGVEMIACGLATHFVLSKDISLLEDELDLLEHSVHEFDIKTIGDIISKFSQPVILMGDSPFLRLETINTCFSRDKVEDILSALEHLSISKKEKWITLAISSMKSSSPFALKVTLRSIREGRCQTLEQCLVRECNMFCHTMRRTVTSDAFEGPRAMLIDKDKKPQWNPSKLELVSDEMVNQFFNNVDDEEWEPLQLPIRSTSAFCSVQAKL